MVTADILEVIYLEACDYVQRISELCLIALGRYLTANEALQELCKYIFLSFYGEISVQLKYSLALTFTTFWNHFEHPEKLDSMVGLRLFPRALRTYISRASSESNRRKKKNQVIIWTIAQGFKKGCMPIRPHQVEKSLLTHKSNLTKSGEVDEILKERIRRIIRDTGFKFKTNDNYVRYLSKKATVESSVRKEGTIGYLKRKIVGSSQIRYPEFLGYVREAHRWIEPIPIYCSRNLSKGELLEVNPSVSQFLEMELSVVPAVILEPLKGRIITKPNAGLYSYLTGLQKGLHNQMRIHPVFSAIGGPVSQEDFDFIAEGWKPGNIFVSGDYSQATDRLKSEVTESICEVLLEPLLNSDDEYDRKVGALALKTLIQCKVLTSRSFLGTDVWKYPFSAIQGLEFDQENGQLMGNVLSFLILCLANYCAYHISYEDYSGLQLGAFSPLLPRVKINGDDILFQSSWEHYYVWESSIKSFGFEKSLGKNFVSDSFMVMNSELWVPVKNDLGTSLKYMRKVPYVNMGLITSRRKQDCSQDLSIKRTGLEWFLDTDSEDLPVFAKRWKASGRIYVELMRDLPEELYDRVNYLWDSHQYWCYQKFGFFFSRSHPKGVKDVDCFESMVNSIFKVHDHQNLNQLSTFSEDFPEIVLITKEVDCPNVNAIGRYTYRDTAEAQRQEFLFKPIPSKVYPPPPEFIKD